MRADHAQYLAQWLQLLKGDSRWIFAAAAKASEAASYMKRIAASVEEAA
jgi:antirestriction protein ArdC